MHTYIHTYIYIHTHILYICTYLGGLSKLFGYFVIVVGVLVFLAGRWATHKLNVMRETIRDPEHLRELFASYDTDGSGI